MSKYIKHPKNFKKSSCRLYLIFPIFFLIYFIFPHTASAAFNDIENSLYKKAIEFLQEVGIVNGYADGTFRPNSNVNRAEMLKILFEAKGVPEAELEAFGNQNCFIDVPANTWYTKYVCYAKDRQYVTGYADGTFRPEASVSLVEAVKLVLKIFEINYDEDQVIWYRGQIVTASDKKYLPPNSTSFDAPLKREQMADLITRVLKDNEGKLDEYLGPRAILKPTYDTIEAAANGQEWDLDPNNNALIASIFLTSNEDTDRVFSVFAVVTGDEMDPSISRQPFVPLFSDEYFTLFYLTSVHCLLSGDCNERMPSKIDDILLEAEQIMSTFSLSGEHDAVDGCSYVNLPLDFHLQFFENWKFLNEFIVLDEVFWDPNASYSGEGDICDGDEDEEENLDFNPLPMLIKAKEPPDPEENLDHLENALDSWLNADPADPIFGNPTQGNYDYYSDWYSGINQSQVNRNNAARVEGKLEQFREIVR